MQDGVIITEWAGAPRFEGELFSYDRICQFGQDPARPESYLNWPVQPVLGPNATFFIPDMRNNKIAVFDRTGGYVGSFGRSGYGPADLVEPVSAHYREGLLGVYSLGQHRLSLFKPSGELQSVITLPAEKSSRQAIVEWTGTDTTLVFINHATNAQGPMFSWVEAHSYDRDWNELAVLETARVQTGIYEPMLELEDRLIRVVQPFAGNPVIHYDPGLGILVTTGLDPVVRVFDMTGRQKAEYRLAIETEPITEEDRSRVLGSMKDWLRITEEHGFEVPILRAKTQLEHISFPEAKAFWDGLFVDSRRNLWLQWPEAAGEYGSKTEGLRFRVLNSMGEYLGDTRWPTKVSEGRVVGELLLAIETEPETNERIPALYRLSSRHSELRW